jgi:hypothetical protein
MLTMSPMHPRPGYVPPSASVHASITLCVLSVLQGPVVVNMFNTSARTPSNSEVHDPAQHTRLYQEAVNIIKEVRDPTHPWDRVLTQWLQGKGMQREISCVGSGCV